MITKKTVAEKLQEKASKQLLKYQRKKTAKNYNNYVEAAYFLAQHLLLEKASNGNTLAILEFSKQQKALPLDNMDEWPQLQNLTADDVTILKERIKATKKNKFKRPLTTQYLAELFDAGDITVAEYEQFLQLLRVKSLIETNDQLAQEIKVNLLQTVDNVLNIKNNA
jgi:hypothetical protein